MSSHDWLNVFIGCGGNVGIVIGALVWSRWCYLMQREQLELIERLHTGRLVAEA